jgi:hypothetical protein
MPSLTKHCGSTRPAKRSPFEAPGFVRFLAALPFASARYSTHSRSFVRTSEAGPSTFVRWKAAGYPPVGKRPGEGDVLATRPDGTKVLRYNSSSPGRDLEGVITELAMYAGESVDDITDLPSAGVLVARLWAECLDTSPG